MKSFNYLGRKAITKFQAVIIAIIIVIAAIAGAAYYYTTTTPSARTPIKIGVILHMSGGPTRLCKEVWDGMRLALEEINSKGGVLGRPIEFILEDDEGKSDKTLAAAKKLVEVDKVSVLAGILISGNVIAISEYLAESKIPYVSPISSAQGCYTNRIPLNSETYLHFIQTTIK